MFDVITIGGASQDIYLESESFEKIKDKKILEKFAGGLPSETKTEIEKAIFETGGGGTNSACTFSRLGLKVAFLGNVGNDKAGSEIKKILKKEKVSTSLIKTDPDDKTAFSIILTSPTQKRIILVYRGAEKDLALKKSDFKKLKTKWFYITSLAGNLKLLQEVANFANDNNIKIALNPGQKELSQKEKLKRILKNIDILILNLKEAAQFSDQDEIEKMAEKILSDFNGTLVITLGAKGVVIFDRKNIFQIKTEAKKNIKDTIGAGDAFGSGFVTGIILKNDISFGLQLGVANARAVLEQVGAKKGLLKSIPKKFNYKIDVK